MPKGPGNKSCHNVRTDCTAPGLRQAVLDNLYYVSGNTPVTASAQDWYDAVAYCVRDRMLKAWNEGIERITKALDLRAVAYLSAEFLIGPQLGSNVLALGIAEPLREALATLGQDLDAIVDGEHEPGLGNGGLGRLAACYMDSMATLGVPAIGYGIHYEFGMFTQTIRDGWQVEMADKWLRQGFPWEIVQHEFAVEVGLGGSTETFLDAGGRLRVRWNPEKRILAVPHDIPVIGYGGTFCNVLRLWSAEAVDAFDFGSFSSGDYGKAVEEKILSETISKVLYPNDEPYQGKVLRLGQQYFFVSASLRDMLRVQQMLGKPLDTFHTTFAIQLNDTHPAVAVAELMRLLVDGHGMEWERAWAVTTKCFSYTNHTLLPEALEKWPVELFGGLLPRHLEIIYEINRRFLEEVRAAYPGDEGLAARLSLIDEASPRSVRMAHLAVVGSHAVNGVAALHTELLKTHVMQDFAALTPQKFCNVTNGVTPRRFLALCNPRLAACITSRIGPAWINRFEEEIGKLEAFADDPGFQAQWRGIKRENKAALSALAEKHLGVALNPDAVFDVQVKRVHEYKRQHLNILRVIALYSAIKRDPGAEFSPLAVLFGGKAAPGYFMAKRVIKLIHNVAQVINGDPDVGGRLTVAYIPNFNVRVGQVVYPAADISQQISLAGKEASGTGNMKFGINGAVTMGTLDGANVEMRQCVGEENFFLFGLTAPEVVEVKRNGYDPRAYAATDPVLGQALDMIASGAFSAGDREIFRPIVDNLLYQDEYMVLADFASYMHCQALVMEACRDTARFTRMSILNVARLGKFSSDRSIRDYCRDIWNITPELG
ncbi:glycogen/starch/alpha-glucan phosphorylase [Desulfovibrio sulfodismutans]|uniref:Alpha-1,4 glucan phosphorylase n=1 Tax=Desulfolutivibrio sulfodismutans TaxID=63561 RepID=A0A7K3NHA0_9BACT|nr:glycogen/starch/alpha-glucan phosphorylase [Desulfolutivibrio sulfodismutans]NDY55467.1 glycogen/starch/alpha-glucan phosphorylase [Desulfolutivibrio sulfodismutans]QLA12855.1 glycogen/starch/alpha-glucan family phosphorylase [Desulfolutivibrio sulfodismutans DSM 3696]